MELENFLLYLIGKDGHNMGELMVLDSDFYFILDASDPQTGERWAVMAEDKYEAAVELMEMMGWDVMD